MEHLAEIYSRLNIFQFSAIHPFPENKHPNDFFPAQISTSNNKLTTLLNIYNFEYLRKQVGYTCTFPTIYCFTKQQNLIFLMSNFMQNTQAQNRKYFQILPVK